MKPHDPWGEDGPVSQWAIDEIHGSNRDEGVSCSRNGKVAHLSKLSNLSNLPSGEVIITRGDHVTPEAYDWVWQEWLAAGKMHLIAGDPGCGKTTIACALGATLTTGGRWPDGTRATPGSVLIWSGEDDVADTLAPRFIASGADMSRVHFVSGVRDKGEAFPFDPANDLILLEQAADGLGDVRLLIVDPIVSAVTGDSHKNAETRRGLQPLVNLASRMGAALLGVTHFSKGTQGRNPTERITGSLAFGAVTRLAMVAAKVEQTESVGHKRILVRAKSNIGREGDGFAYDLDYVPLADYEGVSGSRVAWGASLSGDPRTLLAEAEQLATGTPRDAVKEWVVGLLGTGPVLTDTIKEEGKAAGHSWSTIRRVLADLGGRSNKVPGVGGKWQWELPKKYTEGKVAQVAQLAQVGNLPKGEQVTCARCDGEGCNWC